MKTYTFKPITLNSNNFRNTNNSIDYSKILDNIIATNIKKNNSYLYDYDTTIDHILDKAFGTRINFSSDNEFERASKYLANYRKCKNSIPYKLNTIYKINGKSIIFYDDEIQIGSDLYHYEDFGDKILLNKLATPIKKIIINIYTNCNTIINIK